MKKQVEEPVTTYTVTGKNTPTIWCFTYDLDGGFKKFEIIEGTLSEKQVNWLFSKDRFPYREIDIKGWQKAIKNLNVVVGEPDLSFENFYNLYGHKIDPKGAERAWKKTKKSDKILAVKTIKSYKGYLRRKNLGQAYPATYLNKQLYLSHFNAY